MYIAAQHVVSQATQSEGLNVLYYLHGPLAWHGLPPAGIPDREPGELVASQISVAPPGNLIRSYLDIVAPDETKWDEVQSSFIAFLSQAPQNSLPWVGVAGRCLFRTGLDGELAQHWRHEVTTLYRAAQAIHKSG